MTGGSNSARSAKAPTAARRRAKGAPLICTYLRVRPTNNDNVTGGNTIQIHPTKKPFEVSTMIRTCPPPDSKAPKAARESSSGGVKEFEFSQVLGPESTQEEVYSAVAEPLVSGLFPSSNDDTGVGESALLFAYGATSSGKTHTMMGDAKQKDMEGIIPRAIQNIFLQMKIHTDHCGLNASFFEIYNEGVYDLLPIESKTNAKTFGIDFPVALDIRSDQDQTFVRGLVKHKIESAEHGVRLAQQAAAKRRTSSNIVNAGSSRSHSICQLEVCVMNNDNSKIKTTTMWIVDLAGSERSKNVGYGSNRAEMAKINSSLTNLMKCLSAVKRNQSNPSTAGVVPFRESKLTHLFMSHLRGPSANRTRMIVNVSPAAANFDETQYVLTTVACNVKISQNIALLSSMQQKARATNNDDAQEIENLLPAMQAKKKAALYERKEELSLLRLEISQLKQELSARISENSQLKEKLLQQEAQFLKEKTAMVANSDELVKDLTGKLKKSKESLANLREESNKAIEDMKHEYSKLTVENDNLMDTNEILNDEIYNLKEKIEFLNEDIVMMNIDMSEIAEGGMCSSPESTVAEEKTDNDEEESVRIKIEPSP